MISVFCRQPPAKVRDHRAGSGAGSAHRRKSTADREPAGPASDGFGRRVTTSGRRWRHLPRHRPTQLVTGGPKSSPAARWPRCVSAEHRIRRREQPSPAEWRGSELVAGRAPRSAEPLPAPLPPGRSGRSYTRGCRLRPAGDESRPPV